MAQINDPSDLTRYQSLLSSFSTEVHTAKSSHFHNKINSAPDMRDLFRTFNSLLCPPPPPPTTSITADDFATFFTDKLEQSVTSSQLHTHRTSNQPHPLLKLPSSPSVPHRGGSIQTSPLLPSYNMSSWPNPLHLLQAISPTLLPALTHIINTSLRTGIFPTAYKQARVTHCSKNLH